jgi:hypothetical protein
MSNWNAYCPECYTKFNNHNRFIRFYEKDHEFNIYSCYLCGIIFHRNDFINQITVFKNQGFRLFFAENNFNCYEDRKIIISSMDAPNIFVDDLNVYEPKYSESIVKMFSESDVDGLFGIAMKIKDNMLLE